MKKLILTLLFSLVWLSALSVQADTAEDLAAARSQLENLSAEDSESQIPRERYQQLVTALENTLRYEKKAVEYRQQIEQQPGQVSALKKALAKPTQSKPLKGLDKHPLVKLDQMQTRTKAQLLELERAQSAARKRVNQNGNKMINLREQLGQLRQQADDAGGSDKKSKNGSDALRTRLKNARFSELASQVQALELELLVLPGQTELANLQLQQLEREIAQQRQQVEQIESAIQLRRRSEAEQALDALDKTSEQLVLAPLLLEVLQQNKAISDQVREALAESEQVSTTRSELSKQLKKLDRSHRTIEQQLALDIGYLGGEMRRLMLRVTQPIDTRKTYAQINRLRLLNLEQEQAALDADEKPLDESLDAMQQAQLAELLADQNSLNRRLNKSRQTLVSSLSELLTVQEAYNEQIRQSSELLNENLLWHPSVPTIDLGWPAEIRDGIGSLYKHWRKVQKHDVLQLTPAVIGGMLLVFFSALMALMMIRYKGSHQRNWQQQLGNVRQDRIGHTLKLLLIGPLIAAPTPLFLFILARFGVNPAHPDAMAITMALQVTAASLFYIHTLYLWLKSPWGLFPAHLEVPQLLADILSNRLLTLLLSVTPLLALGAWLDGVANDLVRSGLARLLFLVLVGLVVLFWLSLWRHVKQIDRLLDRPGWWQRAQVWLVLLIGMQAVMAGITLWGYALTAGALMMLQLVAINICLVVFMFYRIGIRWLLIEERKLAFFRARTRRAEILAAREKNEEEPPLEEDLLDLQTISDQARVLLKVGSLALLFSLFWWLLGDLLPTLVVLDNVELWSSTAVGESGEILQPVTLKNLLVAALVFGISLLAARNLPGLLELLLLRHMNLAPGSGYAITTMIKYLLILVGITSGFSQLGFAWEKLQWLVAALSVGLGFGLQEIVANFVSGVIILFEKPVRIGDTVTVGNLTGNVTRIQIRATTITDWDRKEVIIPNKTFITDQLINWSLSDAVTRVVVPVGVAYGSDTALVRSLLLEVAHNNKRLLKDPEPQAFFLGFGDSTLNFDLRVYVAAMADRLEVAHELNNAIDAAFKAHNIEIAFPQLQVHLAKTD